MTAPSSPPGALAGRRVLLFDLDGTLVDSAGDLATAVNLTLAEAGLEPLPVADVLSMVGDGAPVLLRRAFGRHGAEPDEAILPVFRRHYEDHCLDTTKAFPGLPEMLATLDGDGRELAVVTNKPTGPACRVVEGLGLDRWIRFVLGPELVARRKPDPEHVRAALERLGRGPEEAVMIGDSPHDVEAGRGAGVATAAVLWGYRGREEVLAARPDYAVASVAELAALLAA